MIWDRLRPAAAPPAPVAALDDARCRGLVAFSLSVVGFGLQAGYAKVVEDVRGGKMAAIGRLLGGVMKLSGGAADAKAVRDMLVEKLNS